MAAPESYRAALVTGRGELVLQEMPAPEPAEGQALVEIAYCGICGTDLHAYAHGGFYNPAICGHEWSGRIAALRPGASEKTSLREGDRVAVGVPGSCGRCAECRRGATGQCQRVLQAQLGVGRFAAPHGGFAPWLCTPIERLYGVMDGIGDEDAALLEPAAVALHALRRTPLTLGDSVVVLGAGPIGLLVMQCARIAGAGRCVVVEPDPLRAALAGRMGASAVLDPTAEEHDAALREAVGADGADVVFECAGRPEALDRAVTLARRGGAVSLVGMASAPAQVSTAGWLVKEVRLVASLAYVREEFERTMGLVEDGRLDLASLRGDVLSLEQTEQGFQRLIAGGDGAVKLLVDPRR